MIGKYERGEASPSIDAAKKIADALEVSITWSTKASIRASIKRPCNGSVIWNISRTIRREPSST